MSVVHRGCIDARPAVICAHIREYYHGQTGEPPVFYLFPDGDLQPGSTFKQSRSESEDDCNHEMEGIKDKKLWNFFKKIHWSTFFICDNSGYRNLTQTDVDQFVEAN